MELILCDAPHVLQIQAVPELPNKTVRVSALLDVAGEGAEFTVRCTIREAVSRKVVGSGDSGPLPWKPSRQQAVEFDMRIAHCRPWSPEDPFLYEAEVSTPGDTLTARFGMRSFSFDPQTKRPLLNGRPYYLRGTNICIHRFFEDPAAGRQAVARGVGAAGDPRLPRACIGTRPAIASAFRPRCGIASPTKKAS